MRKQFITSEALIRSLRCSFESIVYPSQTVGSIRKRVAKLLPGYLRVLHDGKYIRFYERIDNKKVFLKKDSDRLYLLARKRYLTEVLEIMMILSGSTTESSGFEHQYNKLVELINDFAKGNLDLARIAFTPAQYKWYTGKYRRKGISTDTNKETMKTGYGDSVRSKSEQSIANALWGFAIPCHYEEKLLIDVQPIVDRMTFDLKTQGWREKNVFYYRGGSCYWNIPNELQFMNVPGSIWHTYDYRSGHITIYPDFTIMLADGTRLYWEHEGLLDQIVYRVNAIDRVFIMRSAGNIDPLSIIETEEKDSVDPSALDKIIRTRVIPGLWF